MVDQPLADRIAMAATGLPICCGYRPVRDRRVRIVSASRKDDENTDDNRVFFETDKSVFSLIFSFMVQSQTNRLYKLHSTGILKEIRIPYLTRRYE